MVHYRTTTLARRGKSRVAKALAAVAPHLRGIEITAVYIDEAESVPFDGPALSPFDAMSGRRFKFGGK